MSELERGLLLVAVVLGLATASVVAVTTWVLADLVGDLQRDVACLQHPTSAASSTTATMRDGITIQTAPNVTVCP